jgi:hypothetical protein
MATLQPKLFTPEDFPLTLEEVRQWLQMRDLLEYLRRQKAVRRNGMPEAAAIVDDEIAALDADLDRYQQHGTPAGTHWRGGWRVE